MATVKELTAKIDALTERVSQLEQHQAMLSVLYEAGQSEGYRKGRESVLGAKDQPKVPKQRHLKTV